jgi:hypothetical protein
LGEVRGSKNLPSVLTSFNTESLLIKNIQSIHHLVYYEIHSEVYETITREKRIKKWNRPWKINLIEQTNPQWIDLGIELF